MIEMLNGMLLKQHAIFIVLSTQAVPADALVFPANADQEISLLDTCGEVVSAAGCVGVMETILRHFVLEDGVEGDAIVVQDLS